ncbi:uncharacterized protein [Palaemon carinicauda]|uniref:uncharacterized protein n=1 Tax=Palaemon carinicauda TaxID=392227 RepID=UPI0035B638E5
MKVVLLLLAAIAAANAELEPWCRCAAFVNYEFVQMMVFETADVIIDSCDADVDKCRSRCAEQLNEASNNGDLWYMTEDGITVGQYLCSYLMRHLVTYFYNNVVYGYYEVCGGAWQYADVKSQQMLCCNGGEHAHCLT